MCEKKDLKTSMGGNKMANVYTPNKAESVRRIEPTKDERKKYAKQFKEQKEHERKIKDERFAAIRERRKNNKPGSGGSGGGINIDVTSDS